MQKRLLITLLSTLCLTACSSVSIGGSFGVPLAKHKTNKIFSEYNQQNKAQSNKLLAHFDKWEGTRYKLGGSTKHGIDCSGFTQAMLKDVYNTQLPRTTSEQKYIGKQISKNELKVGDLVFFRKNHHVGIYMGNGNFIHSSTKRGVEMNTLDSGYYAKVFTQARRVL